MKININKEIIDGINLTDYIRVALSNKDKNDELEIIFEKGVYYFYEDFAKEEYLYISNHDHGLKRMAFPILDLNNVVIDGQDSLFYFKGRITPFVIKNSNNIKIKNLTIEYERPFFTEGIVISSRNDCVVLDIDKEKYPYKIIDNKIHFYDNERWDNTYIKWFIEFDKNLKAPTYKMVGSDLRKQNVLAKELDNGYVAFYADFHEKHIVGNIINITHEQRYNPGIFIDESENINIENLTINHAGAMGLIAQGSKDILLDKMKVDVSNKTNRMVSTNNDATHFVNCFGKIEIKHSTFRHQLDDCINIHGIYHVIKAKTNEYVDVEIMHFQQKGVNLYKENDKIAIVNKKTHLNKTYGIVNKVEFINHDIIRLFVYFENNEEIEVGDCLSNYLKMPSVHIHDNVFEDNRARGILISSNKEVLIENNYFHTSGSAICCGGEMKGWYESGPIENLTIQNNRFINCGYAKWGIATISINTEIEDILEDEYVHGKFTVTNNEFKAFEAPVLYVVSLNELVFANNKIELTEAFLPFKNKKYFIELEHCKEYDLVNNSYLGIENETIIEVNN